MKRMFVVLLIIGTTLLLFACSTREDFVVINKSDAVIEIQYKFKRYNPASTPSTGIEAPAKLSTEELWDSDRVWKILSKGQYLFDSGTGTISVNLSPNEALLVDHAYNYRGHDSESSASRFNLASLAIIGVNGSVKFEGKQAQTHFKYQRGAYVITYE